jgi:hypothetical protein
MLTFSFYLKLLKQVRSLRGSLSSRTREMIFSTYGEAYLPPINTNSSPAEIASWKKRSEVANSYKGLFRKMNREEGSPTTLCRIIQKVFSENSNYSNVEV